MLDPHPVRALAPVGDLPYFVPHSVHRTDIVMLLSFARTGALLLLAVLVPLTVGCDSSDIDPPAGDTGTYVGTLAGAQTSGALRVSLDGTEASGSFTVAGGTARSAGRSAMPALTGTYDPDTGALHLEGGGYTFNGTISNGVLSGTWTGPDGTSGSFSAFLGGDGTVVDVYCGVYDTANDGGTFNLVRHDAALRGFAVSSNDGDTIDLSGSVSGNTLTIYATEAGPAANVATATLSADGSTFSGTVNDPENPGTVSASRCTP